MQPTEGATEVVVNVQGIVKGRRRCPFIRNNLRDGGPCGSSIWVGDVGDVTAHW